MNIVKLSMAALGLSFAAVPAQAAIHSIAFTAKGVITESERHCTDVECDFSTFAPVGTPWSLSVAISLEPPLGNNGHWGPFGSDSNLLVRFDIPYKSHFMENVLSLYEHSELRLENGKIEYLGLSGINDPCITERAILQGNTVWINEWFIGCSMESEAVVITDGKGRLTSLHINGVAQTVPEPATWAMMIAGFGLVGAAVRRRHPSIPSGSSGTVSRRSSSTQLLSAGSLVG